MGIRTGYERVNGLRMGFKQFGQVLGKKYYYVPGNARQRQAAYVKAVKNMQAIVIGSGWAEQERARRDRARARARRRGRP